jgi:hypothetical protein
MVLFKFSVYLLIFCVVILFTIESGMLNSPIIISELSVFPVNSVSFCFLYLGVQLLGAYLFIIVLAS